MQEEKEELVGTLTEKEIETIAQSRTHVYDLDWPVEFDNKEALCSVTLNRFRGKDVKQISKIEDQFEQGLHMIITSSRTLTPLEVDLMDMTDLTKMMEICAVFMDASQRKRTIAGK